MNTLKTLRSAERASIALRELFAGRGYSGYKMNRFERYDLYLQNKSFLGGGRMIVFSDLSGELMALKPDVTISIIKNTQPKPGAVRKVCYTESVYRPDEGTGSFREISQTGLECIGNIDACQICEVVLLAAESLALLGRSFVLDVSHLGFVSAALEAAGTPADMYPQVLGLIRDKNIHQLTALCAENGMDGAILSALVTTYGDMNTVLSALAPLCVTEGMKEALSQLSDICSALALSPLSGSIRLDFSVINDMEYYNGVVFQGFVDGLSSGILSGGQYDRLVQSMGKNCGGAGFALYLEELDRLEEPASDDGGLVLLYDSTDAPGQVMAAAAGLKAEGLTVNIQPAASAGMWKNTLTVAEWRERNA